MSGFNITVDTSDMQSLNETMKLFPRQAKQAACYTINRALTSGRKIYPKEVKKNYPSIKSADVKKLIVMKKAKFNDPIGELSITGKRLYVGKMGMKERGEKGFSISIKHGRTVVNPKGMFKMMSRVTGKNEIFKHLKASPYKIGYVYTLSMPQMVSNDDVSEMARKQMKLVIEKYLARDFDYYMSKLRK